MGNEEKSSENFLYSKLENVQSKLEKFYSTYLQLNDKSPNMGSRLLWTNRAKCRNVMGKYEEAISDCESALSINPKCSKTIEQKGNAFLRLGRFDEARICLESLRPLGEGALADTCLKKLDDIQEKAETFQMR